MITESRRRWQFADAEFDEDSWTLTVGGARASLEMKPLLLLRILLLHAGSVVTKDELLTAVWPEVTVVEASLTTAIMKLRRVLDDDPAGSAIIETVRGVGYRLIAPVTVEESIARPPACPPADLSPIVSASPTDAPGSVVRRPRPQTAALSAIALLALIGIGAIAASSDGSASSVAPHLTAAQLQHAGKDAVRRMDLPMIERLIAAGWHPQASFDDQDNDALKALLARCEWDRGHDQRQMMMVGRTLIDGGSDIKHRNVWGDTAYSIAKSPRYCGPDHPVTRMIHETCFSGVIGGYSPDCEADYSQRRPFITPAPS